VKATVATVCADYRHSIVRTRWVRKQGWTPYGPKETFSSVRAVGVAYKIPWFGEGAGRLVKEFREVDPNGRFVGPAMVAKDTRFKRDGQLRDEKEFHRVFCLTQLQAQKFALLFNKKLTNLPERLVSSDTPLVEFLDCCVYMLEDGKKRRHGFLVERMLDIKKFKYEKWNTNDGRVKTEAASNKEFVGTIAKGASAPPKSDQQQELLGIVEEEDEDEEESENEDGFCSDSDEESFKDEGTSPCDNAYQDDPDLSFDVNDIPQAFSCFTYYHSRRTLVVCDLQGVLNTDRTPRPMFELTDPAIHYKSSKQNQRTYGRTDKGQEGIHMFLMSHKCSNLCRLLKRRQLRTTDRDVCQWNKEFADLQRPNP